jgi:hypothetical protein
VLWHARLALQRYMLDVVPHEGIHVALYRLSVPSILGTKAEMDTESFRYVIELA